MIAILCPNCQSANIKKNGHIHNGKQNYRCKPCGRQFVLSPENKRISEETKELIEKLLLERISLRGICRVLKVSLAWLMDYVIALYDQLPDTLNAQLQVLEKQGDIILKVLDAQADELWSFVGNKDNKQWVWIAIAAHTKQVIAFYVGDRSRQSAQKLWERLPDIYKCRATFYTDHWEAYRGVIPPNQHKAGSKQLGKTSIVERFICTLRQRVSRLVRSALSFSKKLKNHIGAIKYFICHYNLALLV